MNIQRLLPLCLCSALLAGCMTVGDFVAMPAEKRAQLVCDNDKTTRNLRRQVEQLQHNIAEAQEAIVQGRRMTTHCTSVIMPRVMEFCEGPHGPCHFRERLFPEERCTTHEIPVDVAKEQANIAAWQQFLTQTTEQYEKRRTPCIDRVLQMPAELAYRYYDTDTSPSF